MSKLTFRLEDFFPYYTDSSLPSDEIDPIYQSNFYTTVIRKKEFNECKSQTIDSFSEDGQSWPHQTFMARFMSPNTPYQNMLVFHGMGTGKCVFPDTTITLHSGKELPIETIWDFTISPLKFDSLGWWKECNIEVATYDITTSSVLTKQIKHVYKQHIREEAVKYVFSNGTSLKCTKQHKLYTKQSGFTNVPKIDDKVVTTTGETVNIIGITYFMYDGYVYDIEVEDTHCYFANHILTHNTCLMAAVSEYAKSILPSLGKTIILVKNDTLKKSVIDEIATKCTGDKYNSTIDPKTGKPLTVESRLIRISAAVSKNYSVMTYYDFAKTLKNVDMSMYNNCYIIIDEAHNLRSRKSHVKTGINSYKLIHKCLHTIIGSKVLLLTGTPMRNSSSEIVSLLNLILPLNHQLSEDNWNQIMFDSEKLTEEGFERLKEAVYGRVSYLRSPTGNVSIRYMGDIQSPLRFTNTYTLEMEQFQTEKYAVYYDKDKLKEKEQEDEEEDEEEEEDDYKKSLWLNSRQASSFIFPNGECGILAEKKYLDIDYGGDTSKSRIYDVVCNKTFMNYLTAEGTDEESILSQIKKCSIKVWFTLRQILQHPKKKTFIYSNFVMGGGIILFAALLKIFQFSSAPIKGFRSEDAYPPARRFLLLSSKTLTGEQMRVGVREIFNSRENVDGDYIQVILGSRIIGEGISFFHVRQMFLLTPNWNNATTEQVIARVIRADSHPDWMEDRTLDIYRLDAKPIMIYYKGQKKLITPESIDSIMYHTSEVKDVRIKQVERVLKQSAVDCALHRSRNINSSDVPNSIQCDYTEMCNYDCLYVDPKYTSANWDKELYKDIITDTYHSYFAFKQIFKMAEKIKYYFSVRQSYDFEELYSLLSSHYELRDYLTPILLARTLYFLIGNNIKIKNHFGFINFLREDNNLYFLVDDAAASTNYTTSYYASNPTYDASYIESTSVYHPSVVCMDYYNEENTVNRIYKLLQEHSNDIRMIQTILLNCDPLVTTDWIEQSYDDHILYGENAPILSKLIYQSFKNVIRLLTIGGEITPVNFYNKNMIRVRLPITNMWTNTTEEEQESIIQIRLEQVKQIKEKFGYYAIIDEQGVFRIKEVAPIQFTQKGEIDSRIARELGALKCGTGKLAKGGLIYRVLLISLKSEQYNMNLPLEDLHAAPEVTTTSDEYITMLQPYIIRYLIEQRILDKLLQLTKEQRKILFKDMYHVLPQKSDDSKLLLRSIIQAKKDTPVDYLSDENCKAIVRELDDFTFIQEALQISTQDRSDTSFYNRLSQGIKDVLAKVIKYKSTTICESLRKWFEDNELTL